MKSLRGLVRKVIGEGYGSESFVDFSLKLARLFVLRPDEGIGKRYLTSLDQISRQALDIQEGKEADEIADLIFQEAAEFSETQRKQIENMVAEFTGSAGELLGKLSHYVEMQSDRIGEIEQVRTHISAAQTASTLDGVREMLSVSLDGLQNLVEAEFLRQKELRSDHEMYTARLQAKLDTVEKESRTDALTGVANRNGCMKKLGAVLDYARTNRSDFRLVLLDLNGFKKINDTLGHAAGDAALIAFSQRLSTVFGKENFVGRLAGDEFIVISNMPEAALRSVFYRLQEQFVSLPATYKGIHLEISFCYGISEITRNAEPTSILEQADIQLYKHKNDFYATNAA